MGKWTLLFFYPKDFTFVCPTEIIAFSDRVEEFTKRNCNVIGASTDSAEVCWMHSTETVQCLHVYLQLVQLPAETLALM